MELTANDKCKWNHRLAFYLARKNKSLFRGALRKAEKETVSADLLLYVLHTGAFKLLGDNKNMKNNTKNNDKEKSTGCYWTGCRAE